MYWDILYLSGILNSLVVWVKVHKTPCQQTTHLLHLDSPHGSADVNDEHDVFRERREVGGSKELDEVTV